jgi:hypothetical protein
MTIQTEHTIDTETRTALAVIEESVVTQVHIADLLRQGAVGTTQAQGWGTGGEACFLSAAALAARDLGYIG